MMPLTVAATLLGTLAGDGAVDATGPHPGENGASQVLLKKMEAMEQRIKSLESQLKQKDAPPPAQKTPAAISPDGKLRGKASRTPDFAAAAPAGDLVADTPPPARRRHPARRRRPTRPTSPPNPPNPPRRRSRTPSRKLATKQSSA